MSAASALGIARRECAGRAALNLLAACALLFPDIARADRLALWTIVHDRCVANLDAGKGPAPCASVDESQGVAILKDIVGVAQYLAIPTRRIAGIESPDILAPDAPPVWSEAWKARALVNARLGVELPRGAIAIAVNSSVARSQDQLHLHVDCLAPDVAAALAGYRHFLTGDWHALPFLLAGRRYWARRLDSTDLSDVAPFRLLADGLPGARADMPMQTLVAAGADFGPDRPGFILLADQAGIGGNGHGEDLQDHTCAISAAR
jgi:CDP-diacylglycerol pyrophosphatase